MINNLVDIVTHIIINYTIIFSSFLTLILFVRSYKVILYVELLAIPWTFLYIKLCFILQNITQDLKFLRITYTFK